MAALTQATHTELRDILPKLQSARMDIQVHVSATLNITSFAARQKVGGVALSKVGTGIGADEPSLIVTNQRVVWRVPLFLALPSLGRLGQVGEIDVDAQTGEVLADGATFARIIARAERLAPDSTP